MDIELVIDNASVELFADGGLTVMTAIFFPNKIYTHLNIGSAEGLKINLLTFNKMKSVWRDKAMAIK